MLYLETDVSNRDRYDRLLRYVWLDLDGEVYLVNEVMVRSGFASFSTYPPDLKYVEEIREAGRFAREHGHGLWSGCLTDPSGDTNELIQHRPSVPPSGMLVISIAPTSAGPGSPSSSRTDMGLTPTTMGMGARHDDRLSTFDA